ncbi:unnamed protein product [Anisakis simplex]|uniref:Response regulatory domain-containing protein n=1 Tax=Anisakis simplex TaxID=6269 RepID=A0A0M3JEU2_ANISI|nr:unnamed protein product [Anisakis simplex]
MNSMNECEERIPNDHPLTRKQHYLCSNANRRRIWLTISRDKEEGASRHEQFSDTIFWTIRLIFRREVKASEGGDEKERNTVDYIYTANNIPESIAVATLLKQFLKPKKIGPVVNRDELDADKMLPFQEAGIDNLLVYMPVPMEDKQRLLFIQNASAFH